MILHITETSYQLLMAIATSKSKVEFKHMILVKNYAYKEFELDGIQFKGFENKKSIFLKFETALRGLG